MTTRLSAKTQSGTIIDHQSKNKGLDEAFISQDGKGTNPFDQELKGAIQFTQDSCDRSEMEFKQNLYFSSVIENKGELLSSAVIVVEDMDMSNPQITLADPTNAPAQSDLNFTLQSKTTAAVEWVELFYDGKLIQRLEGKHLTAPGRTNMEDSVGAYIAYNELTHGKYNVLGDTGPFYIPLNLFFCEKDNAFALTDLAMEIRIKFKYSQFLDGDTALDRSGFLNKCRVTLTTNKVYLDASSKPSFSHIGKYYVINDRRSEYYTKSLGKTSCEIELPNHGLPIGRIDVDGSAFQANTLVRLRTKRGKHIRFEHYFRWLKAGGRLQGHPEQGYHFGLPARTGPCGSFNIANQEDLVLELVNLKGYTTMNLESSLGKEYPAGTTVTQELANSTVLTGTLQEAVVAGDKTIKVLTTNKFVNNRDITIVKEKENKKLVNLVISEHNDITVSIDSYNLMTINQDSQTMKLAVNVPVPTTSETERTMV